MFNFLITPFVWFIRVGLIEIIVFHSHFREIHCMSFLPQPGESLENNDPIESSDEENDDLRLEYIYRF